MIKLAVRKSPMVGKFINHLPQTVCPTFKKLSMSLGCGYQCAYCYLRLTLRQTVQPGESIIYTNPWSDVEQGLEREGPGVYNAGELADALNPVPMLLPQAITWFNKHHADGYTLLLQTKSTAAALFKNYAGPGVIVGFSINSPEMAELYEQGVPTPKERLEAARCLLMMGFRVRIRLDPIILNFDAPYYDPDHSLVSTALKNLERDYKYIVEEIADLKAERVTIGTLRAARNLPIRCPDMKWFGVGDDDIEDGNYFSEKRRFYFSIRAKVYKQIADWLGFRPAICKETFRLWSKLRKDYNWDFQPCNCME